MKKTERNIRILHIILCLLNIGCLFFGIMVMFRGGNEGYRIFRDLNIGFCTPMFFMRLFFLQYIVFSVIAVLYAKIYIYKVKNKSLNKKILCLDIVLWTLAIVELFFLEDYFECIATF